MTTEWQISVVVGETSADVISKIMEICGENVGVISDSYERRTTIEADVATRVTITDDNRLYETKTLLAQVRYGPYVANVSRKEEREPVDPPQGYRITKTVERTTFNCADKPYTIVFKEEQQGDTLSRLIEIDMDGPQEVDAEGKWQMEDSEISAAALRFIAQYYGGLDIASPGVYNKLYLEHSKKINVNVVPVRPFVPQREPYYYAGPKMDGEAVNILIRGTTDTVEVYFSIPSIAGLFLLDVIPLEDNVFVPHAILNAEMMQVPTPHIYVYDIAWINWKNERRRVDGKSLVPRRLAIPEFLGIFATSLDTGIDDMLGWKANNTEFRLYRFTKITSSPAVQLAELEQEYYESLQVNGTSYIDGLIITPERADIPTLSRSSSKRTAQPYTIMKRKSPEQTTVDLLYMNGNFYLYSPGQETLVALRDYAEIEIEKPGEEYNGCVLEMQITKNRQRGYKMSMVRVRPYKIGRNKKPRPNMERTVYSNIREVLEPTTYAGIFGVDTTRVRSYLRSMDGALIKELNSNPIIVVGAGNGGSRWQMENNAPGQHVLWMEPDPTRYKELKRRVSGPRSPKTWYTMNAGINQDLPAAIERFRQENREAHSVFFRGMQQNTIQLVFVMTFVNPDDYYNEDGTGFFDIIRANLAPLNISLMGFDKSRFPQNTWQGLGVRVERLGETTARYRIPGIVGYQEGYIPDFDAIGIVKERPFRELSQNAQIAPNSIEYDRMNNAEKEYLGLIRAVRISLST